MCDIICNEYKKTGYRYDPPDSLAINKSIFASYEFILCLLPTLDVVGLPVLGFRTDELCDLC